MNESAMDQLPENALVASLKEAAALSDQRKGSAQRIGAASLAYRLSENAGQFDWYGRVDGNSDGYYAGAQFIVTCKAETTGVPLVDLAMTVFYAPNGTDWGEYTKKRALSDSYSGGFPEMGFDILELPGVANGPGEARFRIWFYGRVNAWMAFKLQAIGTDDVTLQILRTL